MKYVARQIKDPYAGRGIILSARTKTTAYEIGTSIGLSDKLLGFALEATPWFDFRGINEGEPRDDDKSLFIFGFSFTLLYIRIALDFSKVSGWLFNIGEECSCEDHDEAPRPSLSLV